jgi:hypothetical protein
MKYINGKIKIAAGAEQGATDPNVPPTNVQTVQNTDKGITQEKVQAAEDCKPIPLLTEPANAEDKVVGVKPGRVMPGGDCMPPGWTPPPQNQIAKQIKDVALANGATQEEARYMVKIAFLESTYNQYADAHKKNPESHALGLFQMQPATAGKFYAEIGIASPTCEQRCNVELATKAMLRMVKYEGKGYDSFHANGTIAGANKGQVCNNAYTQGYSSLTRAEFMYMSHGQGQEGMRKGTPGGSGFLHHFRKSGPSEQQLDQYMAS